MIRIRMADAFTKAAIMLRRQLINKLIIAPGKQGIITSSPYRRCSTRKNKIGDFETSRILGDCFWVDTFAATLFL